MSRYPSDKTLRDAAGGDWLNLAACRSQPAFTDQDADSITATCSAHQDVLDFTEATA